MDLKDFLPSFKVIANPKVLELTYRPREIVNREPFIKTLAQRVFARPFANLIPDNLFVYGGHGVGKTLIVSHLCEQLKAENKPEIIVQYVHCKNYNTEIRVLQGLLEQLGIEVHRRGLPASYYLGKLFDFIDYTKCYLILVFDEVDELINNKGDDLLYKLLRVEEIHPGCGGTVSMVCIANDPHIMKSDLVSSKVKSSFPQDNWILFGDYDATELAEIVQKRAEEALKKPLSKGISNLIGSYARKEGGDARIALSYLKNLAYYCEESGVEPQIEFVDEIKNKVEKDIAEEELKGYNEQKLLLLFCIGTLNNECNPGADTKSSWKEVYSKYKLVAKSNDTPTLSERQCLRYVHELGTKKFVELEERADERGTPLFVGLLDRAIIMSVVKKRLMM